MYYEEAVVREYGRKDGRNNKQLNLGVNSKYKKDDKVIIIKSDKIQTFKENLEPQTKQLKENPPINEKMIGQLMASMGRKPNSKQIKQIMSQMNRVK